MRASFPAEIEDKALTSSAALIYVLDDEPGIQRERRGKGFSYRLPEGGPVRDAATLERIRKLAIPPAWTNVWICPDERGHIQATGRDAKGRKQYKYHAGWREIRDATKYDHILAFGQILPEIRRRISWDMGKQGICREKVCATIVRLLDITLVRVGNDEYAEQNGSFGLTTLRNRHLRIEGEELRFHFPGKSGRIWKLAVRHKRVARIVRSCQELPGQRLFQYADAEGMLRTVTSTDINDYLHEIGGPEVSAKDFRTWAGTVLAAKALSEVGPYASEREAKSKIKLAINAVAERLGNTPAICRSSYVHPQVIECYRLGLLPNFAGVRGGPVRRDLSPDERFVLGLLRRRLKSRNHRPRADVAMAARA